MFSNHKARGAYVRHARGRCEEARERYEAAFAQGCDRAKYYAAYSSLLLYLGDYETARDFLRDALDTFESMPEFLRPRKTAKGKEKKNKRFTGRDRANMRLNLALALWKTGEVDRAVKEARVVYETFKTATAYGTLGFLLIAQGDSSGDYGEALALNQEALAYVGDVVPTRYNQRLLGEAAVILDNLGQIYYRQGKMAEALEYFQKAHDKKPTQADTLYFLARIAWEKGETEEARSWIEKLYDRKEFPRLSTVPKADMDALRDAIAGGTRA